MSHVLQKVRYLDKLVDELAKGKAIEKNIEKVGFCKPFLPGWIIVIHKSPIIMSLIISLIAGFLLFCAGQSLTNELMACDTNSIRLLRMLFYVMKGYSHTLQNRIHFLQIRKSVFYNYCNELKAAGFDVRQKEGNFWKTCQVYKPVIEII